MMSTIIAAQSSAIFLMLTCGVCYNTGQAVRKDDLTNNCAGTIDIIRA